MTDDDNADDLLAEMVEAALLFDNSRHGDDLARWAAALRSEVERLQAENDMHELTLQAVISETETYTFGKPRHDITLDHLHDIAAISLAAAHRLSGGTVNDEQRLSVVANAIGFEMLRHDGRTIYVAEAGVDQIDVSADEAARCRVAARRVLDHLGSVAAPTSTADHDLVADLRAEVERLRAEAEDLRRLLPSFLKETEEL